jgi:hypothetical protein
MAFDVLDGLMNPPTIPFGITDLLPDELAVLCGVETFAETVLDFLQGRNVRIRKINTGSLMTEFAQITFAKAILQQIEF